jgi:hypothetical protein
MDLDLHHVRLLTPSRNRIQIDSPRRSEGIITVVIAVIGFWLVHDFPDTAKFLTDDERVRVIGRLQADDQFSAAGEAFAWSNLTLALKDWKTWCGKSRIEPNVPLAY